MRTRVRFDDRGFSRLKAAAFMIMGLFLIGLPMAAWAQGQVPLPSVPAVPPAPGSPAVETELPPNVPAPPEIKKKVEAIISQVKDKAVYVEERRFQVTDQTLIFDINGKPAQLKDLPKGTKVVMVYQALPAPRDPICHELRVKQLPPPEAPAAAPSGAGPRKPKSVP